jgi:ADP-heptose:LPS heptosyltransferase
MRIAVRLEGGIGDHLLANRFVPAITEKHRGAKIDLFSSTNGSRIQSNLLNSLFNYYNKTFLTEQESEVYNVTSQFGRENYPQHIENINKKTLKEIKSYDKWYNLHIDSLEWMSSGLDWQRYFYSFPKPTEEIGDSKLKGENYLVLHLASDNLANGHRMSRSYLNRFIDTIPEGFGVIALSTPSTSEFINSTIGQNARVKILQSTITEVARTIKDCSGLFAIDSGIKYLGHTFNKPTLCWARESLSPHSVTLSHKVRWLTHPQLYFPLEFNERYMWNCMNNLIKTDNFLLAPGLVPSKDNLSRLLLKRELKQA